MWLAILLITGALQMQGNLSLSLDKTVYPDPQTGLTLELYYEIPFSSLSFVRSEGGFAARFSIGVELSDAKGSPVAGDLWQRSVLVADYGAAAGRDSVVSGTVSLSVPERARRGQVVVSDERSDRKASGTFTLDQAASGLRIRLYRQGKQNQSRAYQLDDTLEALAELVPLGQPNQSRQVTEQDSFRFAVKVGRRVLVGGSVAGFDSAGRRYGRYILPIADSAGAARLSAGEYELEARAAGETGRTFFRVSVPFFQDDKAYREKVEELLYVATPGEMAELKRKPRQEREQAWQDFWKKKDPTPTTDRNEQEEEYFRRIEYAKEHFGGADKGFRSDRGRIYVRYGPPDNIEAKHFEIDARASETWYYYTLGLEFTFVDRYGFGEYLLAN